MEDWTDHDDLNRMFRLVAEACEIAGCEPDRPPDIWELVEQVKKLKRQNASLILLARYGLACHDKARALDIGGPGDIDGGWAQNTAEELGLLEEHHEDDGTDAEGMRYETREMESARRVMAWIGRRIQAVDQITPHDAGKDV